MSTLQACLKKRFAAPRSPTFDLDVKIEVEPGFTILFGPSGAGKSTLLDCIAGLVAPDSGRVRIGADVVFDSDEKVNLLPARRGIGYVFQRAALFPNLCLAENVAYGLADVAATERRQKVVNILACFHISGLGQRMPKEISGGEQQRVALARSLVIEPRALLLDEPLSALDSRIKRKILDDLLAWNELRRIPILYVTHSRAETFALGERVIRLEEGKVIGQGTPAEVLHGEELLD